MTASSAPAGRSFLFVLGCQRSGTTALTRLLHHHDEIVLGMERYKELLAGPRHVEFSPELFSASRFLEFRDGDTNIRPDRGQFPQHYAAARERLERGPVRYIGDKLVPHERTLRIIAERFPPPRWVFIYRDLLAVASSFGVRARDRNDRWASDATHAKALDAWNRSFRLADGLIERYGAGAVFFVRYEGLFDGNVAACRAMFEALGLEFTKRVRTRFARMTAEWPQLRTKPLALTEREQRFLLDRVDVDLLRRFDQYVERQYVST